MGGAEAEWREAPREGMPRYRPSGTIPERIGRAGTDNSRFIEERGGFLSRWGARGRQHEQRG